MRVFVTMLFLVGGVVGQTDLVVPTTYSVSNRPRIVVNMVDRSRILENAPMTINTFRATRPMTSGEYGFTVTTLSGYSLFLHGTLSGQQISYDTEISVGYGSEFFAHFGSIMLIPPVTPEGTTGSLILNPTNISNRYCVDGTLNYVQIDPTNPIVMANFEIVRVNPGAFGGRFVHTEFISSTVLQYSIATEQEYITLPRSALIDLMNEISRATSVMPEAPFSGSGRPWSVGHGRCTPETISRMPILKFTLHSDGQPAVEIQLHPNDYLRIDEFSRTCEVLVVSHSSSTQKFGTPFSRGVAIHFDQYRIGFCDPL